MIKEMEKALKRYLKGKNRITMGVVVAFLLGSTFAFGDVTIKYENSTLIVQDGSGTNIGTVTKNSDDEFTWTIPEGTDITETVKIDDTVNANNIKVNIVNNGIIRGKNDNGDNLGNGINSYSANEASTIRDITNNGTISGNSSGGDSSGNGINSYSVNRATTIGNIENYGTISGSSGSGGSYSGNGINSYSANGASTIGNIENYGTISGSTTGGGSNSGNGINSNSDTLNSIIGDITNSGNISGKSGDGYYSGNGINSYSANGASTIGNIENYGTISGSTTGSGSNSGNGIYSYSVNGDSTIGNITNSGNISGKSGDGYYSGNGIYSYSDTSTNSIIGDITNNGTISGKSDDGSNSGNGIYSYSDSTIGDITNSGTISGKSGAGDSSGNGIYSFSYLNTKIGNITNSGTISGSTTGNGDKSGNGICSYSFTSNISASTNSTIGDITNSGTISGSTTGNGDKSGNGIYSLSSNGPATIKSISNYGVIMGSDNGIYIKGDSSSKIKGYSNYGLVIGQTPVKIAGGEPIKKPEGNGMAITIESDGSIKTNGITSGAGENPEGYSIINTGLKDSGKDAYDTFEKTKKDTIINGAGVASGTVTIDKDKNFTLNGGIINAYKTAVTVKDGASFTGTDVTINGAISGDLDSSANSGANTVNISGNSFINGKVDLGDEDDILSIGNSTQINGDIDGGTGTDTLDFGSAIARAVGNDNINLFHKISNVEEININQKVTAFETSEITGADNINIGKNGEFVLRINTSKVDNTSGTDKITGHALYGNTGTISSTGGKLLLALNGAGNESIISFGNTQLDSSLVTGDEGKYQEDITLDTTSLLHSVGKIDLSNNEIKITAKPNLPIKPTNPDNITYEKLNKIYHGILSLEVNGLENFNVDDKKLSSFMGYLNDIYAGNPYSYSSELSRK
uniref:beta strand repeat-containing protein n=1 Tax=Fusobacterium varium TaxID=856 RepID=UPI00359C79A0